MAAAGNSPHIAAFAMGWTLFSLPMVSRVGRHRVILVFDSNGRALTLAELGRRLGSAAPKGNVLDFAVGKLGFVAVRQAGAPFVVEFDPATAAWGAIVGAFYEIADRGPRRVVLLRRNPVRFESFRGTSGVFRRLEALTRK